MGFFRFPSRAAWMLPALNMLRFALLLLILTNARWRERVVRCDVLEVNRFCGGKQLIAWQDRPGQPYAWPQDWTTNPCGYEASGIWFDDSGTAVIPGGWRFTQTSYDPERRAYSWWMEKEPRSRQGGIWRK